MNSTTTTTEIGRIVVTLTLTNDVDEILAEKGFISSDEVRQITLDNVLVDTGATRVCLPADVIAKLGLKSVGMLDVQTAMGAQTVNVYDRLKLNVEGREGT